MGNLQVKPTNLRGANLFISLTRYNINGCDTAITYSMGFPEKIDIYHFCFETRLPSSAVKVVNLSGISYKGKSKGFLKWGYP